MASRRRNYSRVGSDAEHAQAPPSRLPMAALAVVALTLFVNSVSVTILFPFVGFMVVDLGLAKSPDEAGFTAGFILSAFMVGRCASSFAWGYVSDVYGRKPVVLLTLATTVVFSLTFGFSTTFTMALLSRFGAGFFNGVIAVAKTMIAELCPPEAQAKAMSVITGSWGLGLTFGPALGGILSRPALHYPTVFPASGLFGQFPYLLPLLVCAAIGLVSYPVVYTWLPETLPSPQPLPCCSSGGGTARVTHRQLEEEGVGSDDDSDGDSDGLDSEGVELAPLPKSSSGGEGGDDLLEEEGGEAAAALAGADSSGGSSNVSSPPVPPPSPRPSIRSMLRDPVIMLAVGVYCCWSLISILFDEVLPLWAIASIAKGGLGFSASVIGSTLAVRGVVGLTYQLLLYPRVAHRLGPVRCVRYGAIVTGALSLMPPFLPALFGLTPADTATDSKSWALWVVLCVVAAVRSCGTVTVFTSIFLCINNSCHTFQRGTVNGVAMGLASLFKAVGPALGTNLFAWSINTHHSFPFGSHLVFFAVSLLCFGLALLSLRMPTSLNSPKA